MIECDQRKKVIGNLDVHELLLDNKLYIYSFQDEAWEDGQTTNYGQIPYG